MGTNLHEARDPSGLLSVAVALHGVDRCAQHGRGARDARKRRLRWRVWAKWDCRAVLFDVVRVVEQVLDGFA